MAPSGRAVRYEEDRTDTRTNIKVAARKLFAERGLEFVEQTNPGAEAGAFLFEINFALTAFARGFNWSL